VAAAIACLPCCQPTTSVLQQPRRLLDSERFYSPSDYLILLLFLGYLGPIVGI
jgi:hypothetical protein